MTDCFILNSKWWNTEGAKYIDHPLLKYVSCEDKDDILKENPLSKKLIELNKYVITYGSQDSKFSNPSIRSRKEIKFYKNIYKNKKKQIKKYKEEKTVTLQRSYIQMWCKNKEQAYKIINAVKDFCHYTFYSNNLPILNISEKLNEKNPDIDCSEIYDTYNYVNLTTILWPLRFEDKKPLYLTSTNMFHPKNEYKYQVLNNIDIDEKSNFTIPDSICTLNICINLYNMIPEDYTLPENYQCACDQLTDFLYTKILKALQ